MVGKRCKSSKIRNACDQCTNDGLVPRLQVNHISGALLTLLVLPNLLRSAEKSGDLSRITLISSGTHKWKNFPKGEFSAGILATLNDSAYFASQVNTATYPHTKREFKIGKVC